MSTAHRITRPACATRQHELRKLLQRIHPSRRPHGLDDRHGISSLCTCISIRNGRIETRYHPPYGHLWLGYQKPSYYSRPALGESRRRCLGSRRLQWCVIIFLHAFDSCIERSYRPSLGAPIATVEELEPLSADRAGVTMSWGSKLRLVWLLLRRIPQLWANRDSVVDSRVKSVG